MIYRTEKGYYCKIKHEKLYNKSMLANEKYVTPEMLEILLHNFSTQNNESLCGYVGSKK